MDYIKALEEFKKKGVHPSHVATLDAFAWYLATLGEKEASKCEACKHGVHPNAYCGWCEFDAHVAPQPIKEEKIEELEVQPWHGGNEKAIRRKINELVRALNRRTDK